MLRACRRRVPAPVHRAGADGYGGTGRDGRTRPGRDWLGQFYYRPPGGESWADVAFRVRSVLTDLANTEKAQRILVASHDVVILLFIYVAEGLDEAAVLERSRTNGLRNAAIVRIMRDEDSATGWTVTAYNEDAHLTKVGVAVTDQPGASDEVGGR